MAELRQFKLPDVGEGLTEGEILQWLVAVGDTVTVNQPLCEVETAKAAVELPSPYAGTVTELLFEAGTMVDVGTPIITIDVGGGRPAPPPAAPPRPRPASDEPAAGLIGGPAPGGRTVGAGRLRPAEHRGPPSSAPRRRAERRGRGRGTAGRCPRPTTAPGSRSTRRCWPPRRTRPSSRCATAGWRSAGQPRRTRCRSGEAAPSPGAGTAAGRPRPAGQAAGAQVRQGPRRRPRPRSAARGAGGVITRADVEAAASGAAQAGAGAEASPARGVPARDAGGREQRIPIKGVRKHTAAAMVASAFTAPHVTEFLTVDVTRMMKLRAAAGHPAGAGRGQGQPAAVRRQGAAARGRPAPDGQQLLGRGRPGDRGQGLR